MKWTAILNSVLDLVFQACRQYLVFLLHMSALFKHILQTPEELAVVSTLEHKYKM